MKKQNSTLRKITTRAKAIRKLHPSMKWTSAIKAASKELKSKGAVGKTKKAGTRRRKVGKKRISAIKLIERNETKATPVKKTYRYNRDKGGRIKSITRIAGVSTPQLKSEMVGRLKQTLGELHVKREMNTKAGTHKRLTKQIAETRRKIKYYS